MSPEVEKIRRLTPMTEAWVAKRLAATAQVGLGHEDNMLAYHWRNFELHHPWLARAAGLCWFGPRIAFARNVLGKGTS